MATDPYATLETPEAGNRAMRLIHARRGDDEVYRAEVRHVLGEIAEEANGDTERLAWSLIQVCHALVRVGSALALTASTNSDGLMPIGDVLKTADAIFDGDGDPDVPASG